MQDSQYPAVTPQSPAATRRRAASLFPSPFRLPPSRPAFTLTELLIVIAIIAVLAGLIAAAAVNAMKAARRGQILLEIKNISGAIENFKNDYGAYPPNGMNPGPVATNPPSGSVGALVKSDFVRMFKKAFPKHNEPTDLIIALAGVTPANTTIVTNGPLPDGMTAAESLYFWLGGFSADEQYPISGPGGPSFLVASGEVLENRTRRYEFDLGRLGPRNDNGTFKEGTGPGDGRYLLFNSPIPGENNAPRRINLWRYTAKSSEQPLVYFDTSRHKPYQYDPFAAPGTTIYPIKKTREGLAVPATVRQDVVYVDNKYQILHCGLDDDWGDLGVSASTSGATPNSVLLFPVPPDGNFKPFIGPIADTLANFADGELADEAEQ